MKSFHLLKLAKIDLIQDPTKTSGSDRIPKPDVQHKVDLTLNAELLLKHFQFHLYLKLDQLEVYKTGLIYKKPGLQADRSRAVDQDPHSISHLDPGSHTESVSGRIY